MLTFHVQLEASVSRIMPPHIIRVRKITKRIESVICFSLDSANIAVHTMGGRKRNSDRMRLLIFYFLLRAQQDNRKKKLSSLKLDFERARNLKWKI